MIKKIFIFTVISLIVIGCTQKNNVIGAGENNNPEPISFEISSDFFETFISYEDSIKNSNSSNLLVGNYENNGYNTKAISLLKLTSLPDSAYLLNNVHLSFKIKERYNFDIIDETTFKIAKITSKDWFETTATYFSPTDSTYWNGRSFSENDYEIINEIITEDYEIKVGSLNIKFPADILLNWITDTTSTNHGLAIIPENEDSFIELYSTEFSDEFAPKLCFDLQETEIDTLISYQISYQTKFDHDTFIYSSNDTYNNNVDELNLANIQPIKSFIKFNIYDSLFTNTYNDTTNFIHQLTINKAELILQSKSNSYPISSSMSIEPFLVTLDTLDITNLETPIINSENIEDLYITSSTDSLNSNEFKIDITKIIQAFTSGEYENNGIILKSVSENNNFIHEEFDIDETKIRITFTPPYLNN